MTRLCGLGFAAVAAAAAGHLAASGANDPGGETLKSDEDFAVSGDDNFALAAGDGTKHLPAGFVGRHDEPFGDGIFGGSVERAAIVDATYIAGDKAGTDERDFNARGAEFRSNGVGERADGEFAHRVGRSARRSGPTGNTTHDGEMTPGFLERRQCSVEGAEDAEDIGFELPPVVVERKFTDGTDDAEASVGDNDVEVAVSGESFRDRALKIAVAGDIGFDDQRHGFAGRGDALGEAVEQFSSPGGEGEARAELRKLPGEFFADAGRRTGDEYGFAAVEVEDRHGQYGTTGDRRPATDGR